MPGVRPPAAPATPGNRHPRPKTGPRGPTPKLAAEYDRPRRSQADRPDHSPAEATNALRLPASVATTARARAALGLTFNKPKRAIVTG